MIMPLISPVLLLIFLSIIFVLIYLYKTSELMNKKKLSILIIFFSVSFILSNILYYFQNKPPATSFRLTIFPLNVKSAHLKELCQAIPEIISKNLYRAVKDQAVIVPFEGTKKIIHSDSLLDKNYVRKFNERINSTHYFYGTVFEKRSKLILKYRINSPSDNHLSDSVSFSIEQLPFIAQQVTKSVHDYLQVPVLKNNAPQFTNSISALENYMVGYSHFLAQDFSEAVRKLSQAISIDSSFAEAYTLLARIFLAQGIAERSKNKNQLITEFKKAKFYATRAIKFDSINDENYRILGEYYLYNERWSQAEILLQKAFQLNSYNYRIYIPFSRFHEFRYKKIGFRNEEQLYKRTIFINPCYEDGYMALADYYLFNNRRGDGIKTLNKYLKINPNSVLALMALGKIHLVRNESHETEKYFQKITELEPQNSDAYYNLGILYYNTEKYENAKKYFEQAISIDNNLNSYLYLAYIYELEGDKEKTIYYLRKRIHFRTALDDEFAEEARKHLYKLLNTEESK